ncbi:hypothetical protein F4802DRAFT_605728 [Xylaria palmicola]|nr:hypothetical protein F4802DRAFT_605728 [Xylaria palmicola]
MFALQDVPGKGKGLVAVLPIARGTRILSERPLVTSPQNGTGLEKIKASIGQQVNSLSEAQREAFLSLHNIHPYSSFDDKCLGIFRTNAHPVENGGIDGGIFLETSRINHACDNNAQKYWNTTIKRHTIHAIREIAVGEEITITYLGALRSRRRRQETLRAKFGFTCLCRLCILPERESKKVDNRLESIFLLDEYLGSHGVLWIWAKPLKMVRMIDRQVSLYNEHGPNDIGLPRAFLDVAQVLIAHDDLARARVFIERALSGWEAIEGKDSPTVNEYRHLLDNPSSHQLHGMSSDWASGVHQVPRGLAPDEFEDWLWRRDKSRGEGQYADLRHRTFFPALDELPEDRELDLDFYGGSDGRRPSRHWCFLAEISDSLRFFRLQMEVKDIKGRKLPVFFHTESRGLELGASQVEVGHTVAILYAHGHGFMDGQFGIRHETPERIQIFPCSLQHLLGLSDRVQEFSGHSDSIRVCHGCGKKGTELQKCSRCSFFWYCDKACQTAGWNKKDHKSDCKLLKNPDLQGLFSLQWGQFNKYENFPLL